MKLAKDLRRVMIFGPSGSGKTTFANDLGKILESKVIHLDDVFWGPNWKIPDTDDFRNEVLSQMPSDKWVIDGNYSRIRSDILPKATFAIFLCLPKPLIYWRIFARTVARNSRFKFHNPTPLPLEVLNSGSKEFILESTWELISFSRRYYKNKLPGMIEEIKASLGEDNYIILSRSRDVKHILTKIKKIKSQEKT